jgi:NAD(P)-dependent dehydrogenase (short-subunit alcohol dehydrogenase family)
MRRLLCCGISQKSADDDDTTPSPSTKRSSRLSSRQTATMPRTYNRETPADQLVKDFAPQIKGSVILTTGVSPSGLGDTFVQEVAKGEPALMILTGRTVSKTQKVADAITSAHPNVKVRVLELDLGSLAGARRGAETVNGWADVPYIDVLVNNAGIMAVPYQLSPDGIESTFATNHLAHFLFTNLIIDKIMAAKQPRIVNVTSDGHRLNPIRWADYNFDNGKTYNKWQSYGQSKTANMLYTKQLVKKLGPKGLLAFSVHPGQIATTTLGSHLDFNVEFAGLQDADKLMGNADGWMDTFPFKEPILGVATHVFGAYSPDLKEHNGKYLMDSRVADPYTDTVKPWATNSIEADRLWTLSEKLVGQKFDF